MFNLSSINNKILSFLIINGLLCSFVGCGVLSSSNNQRKVDVKHKLIKSNPIPVEWVSNLEGDFSFTSNWSYNEGVYRNSFGQLSCDGFCPERIDNMKNTEGMIIKDSLSVFYELVDTSYNYHNLNSYGSDSVRFDVNFIEITKINATKFSLFTTHNSYAYGSLDILIADTKCYAQIVSISPNSEIGTQYYNLIGGKIVIDSEAIKDGVFKSKFNFTFELDDKNKTEWRGTINLQVK